MKHTSSQERQLLVIDDDLVFLHAFSGALSLRLPSLKVVTATSGRDGLRQLQAAWYDLVLCDMKMPQMDGFAFLHEAKKLTPQTPIAMITAHGDQIIRKQAFALGATAFIEKPLQREQLIKTIAQLAHVQN